MRLLSNVGAERVVVNLPTSCDLTVATSAVSIPGMANLQDAHVLSRLLLSSELDFQSNSDDRGWRNALQSRGVGLKSLEWLAKADVRVSDRPLRQSLIASGSSPVSFTIVGDCEITTAGLGIAPTRSAGLVQLMDAKPEIESVMAWFEGLWQQAGANGEDPISEALRDATASYAPMAIYQRALTSVFSDMDRVDSGLIDRRLGLEDTRIWQMLYRFQRDGALGAIGKLRQWGGCIIADSVGLGKTFEALAVIKYHELRNDRVLVLAPKRLRDNWTLWTRNDIRNQVAADRFGFDVLNHTDLSRDGGLSGDIDLEHINWGNYGLVVIDESHNFRNRPTGREGESRYDRLMRDIVKAGIRTKVLMLSATPVNNRLNDLKNQIAFATEGDDAALADAGIKSIAGTVRLAQASFNKWQALPADRRTSQRLLDMLGFDYVRLLDLLTIARSRKHIERYYGIDETGRFPEKLPPDNRKNDVALDGSFPPISAINDEIRRLTLAAYAPLRYVLSHKREEYDRRYSQTAKAGESVFRQLDREESLVGLMRINPGNLKVLVFTAFADTAAYLYGSLVDEVAGITALVTGSGSNKVSSSRLRSDLATILTAFAPQSRGRPESLGNEPEIDLLIATDCISEGQNLQDCDCVVNYDIHWNPVRIVQRFGRIDRLGSPNQRIKLVNFWPNMDLDSYIGLERTVSGRMKLLDVSATGEENIIEADPGNGMNDLEYRRRQLEAMQNQVIELEDLSQGVAITDLTLNDLRLDLSQIADQEREAIQRMPLTAYAPVPGTDDIPPGAIFVLRAETPAALNALDPKDPLRPYALIHVREDGRMHLPHTAPKHILDSIRKLARLDPAEGHRLWQRFDRETRKGLKMGPWQALLEAAIGHVTGTAQERAIDSLFTTGAPQGMSGASGLDDWEVVAWFPVLASE